MHVPAQYKSYACNVHQKYRYSGVALSVTLNLFQVYINCWLTVISKNIKKTFYLISYFT